MVLPSKPHFSLNQMKVEHFGNSVLSLDYRPHRTLWKAGHPARPGSPGVSTPVSELPGEPGWAGAGIRLLQGLWTTVHLGSGTLRKVPGVPWKPPTTLRTDADKPWARGRWLCKGKDGGLTQSPFTRTLLARAFLRRWQQQPASPRQEHSPLGPPRRSQSQRRSPGEGTGRAWPSCISS